MGLLDGKVAIVTGAGGGLGRCHALLLAKEGAKVVVNDLGVACDGTDAGQPMAEQVVGEIKAAGGDAVANMDTVSTLEGGQAIVNAALEAFGRADILVNNAGILRDKTFLKMEEAQWDAVIAVHLKGTFACSQAFARHVRERADGGDPGGRIINTSSYAGLMGNYGQSNYSAAKAGIAGLTRTWAAELAKLGVTVNAIAPMAKTRMTESIAMVPDSMKAEQVAPMVLYLASELAKDVSGRIFGIHGQQLLEYRMIMTDGVTKEGEEPWTPEEIHAQLAAIAALPGAKAAPAAQGGADPDEQVIAQAFAVMPKVFLPDKAKGWNASIVFDITDGAPWTLSVKDGVCTTAQGKADEATCVVTVDKGTYAKVLLGKEKAEKAFMAGKIKATNLGDMMKFGAAFDMKKGQELAAKAPKPAAAAAPDGDPAERSIAAVVQALPGAFVPDKAKGWSATIHLDITDGTPWTLAIADGACTASKGKVGEASCVVTVDKATYAAIVTGELKAEKAFMKGKVKASNLADMMKFGAAFDMKKARAVAKQAVADAPPTATAPAAGGKPTPEQIIDTAFTLLPEVFVAERAKGWTARIVFDIQGADPWTVAVADGACTTAKGKADDPTCVVTVDKETYAKVVSGEERPEKAFMAGKIKATNLGDMMKFGSAFDMKKAREVAKQAGPKLTVSAPAKPKGIDRAQLGRRFKGKEPVFVKPEHVTLFAEATQDANPRYAEGAEDRLAPPMFAVRLLKDVLFQVATDPDLGCDLVNLVHGEQEMEFLRPLRPWDLVATRATPTHLEQKATGQLLQVESEVYAAGELAVRVRSALFIRDPSKKKEKKGGEAPKAEEPKRDVAFSAAVTVPEDGGLRYAEASLDNNPIHTDLEVAKLAGFPGVILQGLCTMAYAAKAVVDEACGGDPARLRKLSVRFAKPVLMGDILTTKAWAEEGEGRYGLRVVNQDGATVLSHGVAEVAS